MQENDRNSLDRLFDEASDRNDPGERFVFHTEDDDRGMSEGYANQETEVDDVAHEAYSKQLTSEEESQPMTNEERYKEFRKWVWMAACFAAVAVFCVFAALFVKDLIPPKSNESTEDSEGHYEGATMYGIVLKSTDTSVTVYSADTHKTLTFDLTTAKTIVDEFGLTVAASGVEVGRIVQVQYNAANRAVDSFRYWARAKALYCDGVKPFSTDAVNVEADGNTYTVDPKVVCMYEGLEFPTENLNEDMLLELVVLEGHLYKITVLYASAGFKFASLPDEYLGLDMAITRDVLLNTNGAVMQVVKHYELCEDFPESAVLEGLNHFEVYDGDEVVAEGDFLASADEPAELILWPRIHHMGTLKFSINVPGALITIDDNSYLATEAISLPYGEYDALVRVSGYNDVILSVNLDQAYKVINVDMSSTYTTVHIISSMTSSLYIDGEFVTTMRGAAVSFKMNSGLHIFRMEMPGYEPIVMEVNIVANEADKVLYFTDFRLPQESESKSDSESENESESSAESTSGPESGAAESEGNTGDQEPENEEN